MSSSMNQHGSTPIDLKGWLFLVIIFAVSGAVLGHPGRGPVSADDYTWQKWGAIVLQWVLMGALIGFVNHRILRQPGSAWRSAIAYATMLPILMMMVEALRMAAAWYVGGWEAGARSAGVGALVGVVLCPILTAIMAVIAKAISTAFKSPK